MKLFSTYINRVYFQYQEVNNKYKIIYGSKENIFDNKLDLYDWLKKNKINVRID